MMYVCMAYFKIHLNERRDDLHFLTNRHGGMLLLSFLHGVVGSVQATH